MLVENTESGGKLTTRDKYIVDIYHKGLKQWKVDTGYHQRSKAETQFSSLKRMFGSRLKSRLFDTQKLEMTLKCIIFNKMTKLTKN